MEWSGPDFTKRNIKPLNRLKSPGVFRTQPEGLFFHPNAVWALELHTWL